MRIGANAPYDWDPGRADEAFGLLRLLRAEALVVMSHTPLPLWERLVAELPGALYQVRLKGNAAWWPSDLGAREWVDERSAGESIEWLLGRGVTPHVLLYNEPDIELPPDGMADDGRARHDAWEHYRDVAAIALSRIRSEWGERARVALAPLSQGNPERFAWWAERYAGSGLLDRCDFVAEHCYTDGRPHGDPDWGGRFRRWAARAPGKPVHLTEVNDNGAFAAADPHERARDFAAYARFALDGGLVESLSLFTLPGGKADREKPSWWWLTPEIVEAVRGTLDAPPLTRLPETPEEPRMPEKDPWACFTAEQIAAATGCPPEAVAEHWPHIHYALDELGIADCPIQAAAIATVAIETASTFRPIHEFRRADGTYPSHYSGGGERFHGRGYIQLTHDYNYRTYGDLLGVDLLNDPDRALEPSVGAWVLAHYFKQRGVADAARAADWERVRRKVQGGTAGLERLRKIIRALGPARPTPAPSVDPEPAIAAGLSRVGDPYAWDGERPGGFDCSGFATWVFRQVGIELPSFTDAAYDATRPAEQPGRGDLIFYRYADPNQPGVRYPHMGIWLGDGTTLEARYPDGVGVYRPLTKGARELRRVPGVKPSQPPAPAPTPTPTPPPPTTDERLAELVSRLGYLTGPGERDLPAAFRHEIAVIRSKAAELNASADALEAAVATLQRHRP